MHKKEMANERKIGVTHDYTTLAYHIYNQVSMK